jgi:hypothetical protein
VATSYPKKSHATGVALMVASMHLPVTTSLFFYQPRMQRILVRGAAMHTRADAAPFCRLCDIHLRFVCVCVCMCVCIFLGGGGDAPVMMHASRIQCVMVPDVHALGVSSREMAMRS